MSSFASFNGTYKRTPTVSFRGSSKTESREQLLERAQKERLKREVSLKYFLWKVVVMFNKTSRNSKRNS